MKVIQEIINDEDEVNEVVDKLDPETLKNSN